MFEIAFPWAFLLLPLPLLIWFIQPHKQPDLSPIRTPLFDFWQTMKVAQSHTQSNLKTRLLLFLIWSFFILSASKPQWVGEPIELPTSGRDLLLSIDVSASMQEEDLQLGGKPVNRLAVVKSILSEFIEKREGDRIGLILFGDNAYLQTPLTFDLTTVRHMLGETEIGLAGGSKTAIGDGIGLSVKRLRERPKQNRVLILLTDGRNNAGELAPIEAAKLALHAGVKIYTIGIGADEVVRHTLFGARRINPSAELDEDTLTKVAQITGGRYFRAKSTENLAKIYQLLDQLEPVEDEPETYRPVKTLYHIPAGLALLFLLLPILSHIISTAFAQYKVTKNTSQVV